MALLEGFLPIEIKEADNIEVNFNQTEQEVEIKLTKNGETISTKVIKLTNSNLKKFWTGVLEGPSIDIGTTYQGIEQNDFYYNIDTNELNIVTQVNEENFIVIKVNHRYVKDTTPPASYVESDFRYEEGDVWVNSLTKQVWMLVSIDENEEYAWTTIGLPEHIDYDTLEDKPKINGVTIEGTKTAADYHLATKTEVNSKQEKLTAGNNITIDANNRIDAEISSSSINYNDIQNKPQINGVVLSNNKSLNDFNIQSKLTAGEHISINNNVISATGVPSQLTAGRYINIDSNNRINVTLASANGIWHELYNQATTEEVSRVTIPLTEVYDNYIVMFNFPYKGKPSTPSNVIINRTSNTLFDVIFKQDDKKVTSFTSTSTWDKMDLMCIVNKISDKIYAVNGASAELAGPDNFQREYVDDCDIYDFHGINTIDIGIYNNGTPSSTKIASGVHIQVYGMSNDDVEPFPYEIGNGLQIESNTLKFQNGTQKTYITTESDFGDNQVQRTANKTNFPNVQVGDLLVYNPTDPDADDARRLYVADKIGDVGVRWRSLNNYSYLASKPKINGVTIDGDQVASNYGLVDADYVNGRASNGGFLADVANNIGSYCTHNNNFVSTMWNSGNFKEAAAQQLGSSSTLRYTLNYGIDNNSFYNKGDINNKLNYELVNTVVLNDASSGVEVLPSSQAGQYDDLLLIADAKANDAANDKTFIAQIEVDNNYTNYTFDNGFDQTCYLELERKTENLWEVDTQIGVSNSAKHLFAELGTAFEYNNKVTALSLRPNGSTSQSFKAGSKFVLYGKKKF